MSKSIISQVDFKQLQVLILETISMVFDKQEITFEDLTIVDKSMNLWVNCILYKNDLIEDFYTYSNPSSQIAPNASLFFINGLYCYKKLRIRDIFKTMFSCLARAIKNESISRLPLCFILDNLVNKFPSGESNDTKESKQFFELLTELLDVYYTDEFKNHPKYENVVHVDELLSKVI